MNLLLDPSSKRSNSKFQCTISVQVWITTCGIKGNKAFFLSSHTHYNWQWEKDYEKDEKVAQGDLAAPSFCLSFSVGITASRVSTAPSHHLSYLSPSRLCSQWRRRCFWWHWHGTGPAAQWGCKPLALPACSLWCCHSAQKSRYNWVSLKSWAAPFHIECRIFFSFLYYFTQTHVSNVNSLSSLTPLFSHQHYQQVITCKSPSYFFFFF